MDTLESLDCEISSVDEESVQLQTCLRGLHVCRNSLALLFRLPAEVIAHIVDMATCCRYKDAHSYDGHILKEHRIVMICLMGVCTQLHSIVLNTPHLWANINISRCPEWTDMCTAYAQSSSLTVSLNELELVLPQSTHEHPWYLIEKPDKGHICPVLAKLMPYVQYADVRLHFSTNLEEEIDEILSVPALPKLTSLTYIGPGIRIPSKFLSSTRKSVHLNFRAGSFDMRSCAFPVLTHVDLRTTEVDGNPETVFHFLEQSPRLEDLHIDIRCFSIFIEDLVSVPARPICLPRLRKWHLEVSMPTTMLYLRVLPPPTDKLCIHISRHEQGALSVKPTNKHLTTLLNCC